MKRGYFGLAVTYADVQETIPVIDRTDDLEFRLVSAIARMTTPRRPALAFMTGFDARESFQYRAFRQSLDDRYSVTSIDLAADSVTPFIPDSIDVLVVAAPTQPVSPRGGGRDRRLPGPRWCGPAAHGTAHVQSAVPHGHTGHHRA